MFDDGTIESDTIGICSIDGFHPANLGHRTCQILYCPECNEAVAERDLTEDRRHLSCSYCMGLPAPRAVYLCNIELELRPQSG